MVFNPPKQDGVSTSFKNGKNEVFYTAKGKTFRVKSGELKFIQKLVSYSLEKESITTCKDLGSTLFFELEKQGLTQDLPQSSLF